MRLILACLAVTLAAPGAAHAQALDPAAIAAIADVDGDGRITRAEFITARGANFSRLDANKDAALTVDEFRAAAPKGMAQTMAGAQFARFDADDDGKLTLPEFNAAPAPAFDRADANKDGALDKAEAGRLRR